MIELKLDTNAVSHLIDSDPTFKLKIQQAVLANIAGRYVKNVSGLVDGSVKNAVEAAQTSLLKDFGSWSTEFSGKHKFNLKSGVLDAIKSEIQSKSQVFIREAIRDAIEEQSKEIESRVKAYVDMAMKEYTTKAVSIAIKDRLDAAMTNIKASI